jgi:hypothetical protein
MNIDFSKKITSLSLLLLCVAYAFFGWYLSAYHIIWLVGSFIATVAFFGGRKNSSLFERSLSFFLPGSLGIFIISLIVSVILFALAVNSPILGILIITPLATTVPLYVFFMYYTVASLPPLPRITRYQHNLILYGVFPYPVRH